jgi:ribonuclease H / adenosylcobalamin/alpha-ribazole phosphatase
MVTAKTGSLHVCSNFPASSVTATILLIRHAAHVELGKTLTGRRENVSLSRDGLDQATIVADLLGVEPLDAVYSSPRERAFYTAREIAEPHEHEVTISEALDEVDFGDWTGRAFDDLEGEAMGEAVARAVKALEAIAADWPDGTVAAVSHCDIIRGVIAHYLGLPLDNLLRFDIDPASVSRLKVGSWGARVMSVNERLYQ